MLQELLAIAPRCSLSVDISNRAIHLYERLGFVTVRTEDQYSAVMERSADQG